MYVSNNTASYNGLANYHGLGDDFDDLGPPPPTIYGEEIDTSESFPGEQQVIMDATSSDPDVAMAARAKLYKFNVQSTADQKIAEALEKQGASQKKFMLIGGGVALAVLAAVFIFR